MFDATGLVVVANESHHRSVISSCYHGVGGAGGDAVLAAEAEEGRTEHTSLRCTYVQDYG